MAVVIKNATQFVNFMNEYNLIGLDPIFNQVAVCLSEYQRACACTSPSSKDGVYQNCKNLYNAIVRNYISKYRGELSRIATNIAFLEEG